MIDGIVAQGGTLIGFTNTFGNPDALMGGMLIAEFQMPGLSSVDVARGVSSDANNVLRVVMSPRSSTQMFVKNEKLLAENNKLADKISYDSKHSTSSGNPYNYDSNKPIIDKMNANRQQMLNNSAKSSASKAVSPSYSPTVNGSKISINGSVTGKQTITGYNKNVVTSHPEGRAGSWFTGILGRNFKDEATAYRTENPRTPTKWNKGK